MLLLHCSPSGHATVEERQGKKTNETRCQRRKGWREGEREEVESRKERWGKRERNRDNIRTN